MYPRSKVLAVESISVMLVLVLFAFVTVTLISSGSSAYSHILGSKKAVESARVAYSFINMKVKQNDAEGRIDVVDTAFGSALKIDVEDGLYSTYIFYSEGALYECLTITGGEPSVEAGNLITKLSSFEVSRSGRLLTIRFTCGSGDTAEFMEGVVSLRT
jgi:hypothetical protein